MNLEEYLAVEEIKRLRARYSHYCDSLEFEKFLELFTEDAVFVMDEKHGGTMTGLESFRAYIEKTMEKPRRDGETYRMFHLAANPLVELTGENEAVGRWYLLDYNFAFPDGPLRVVGVYHDRYRRENGRWKFSEVRLQFVYPYRAGEKEAT